MPHYAPSIYIFYSRRYNENSGVPQALSRYIACIRYGGTKRNETVIFINFYQTEGEKT